MVMQNTDYIDNAGQEAAERRAPLVSIILPMYNSARTIECCIESIKEQSFEDFEAILIDDGSTDDTLSVAAKSIRADERFTIVSRENHGVSPTRNFALQMAHGEWIAFIDSDDWFAPYAIGELVKGAQGGADLVVADFYRVNSERYAPKGLEMSGLYNREDYVKLMFKAPANFYFACLWNKLFKRSIIEDAELRFDEHMRFSEDHLFVLRYMLCADNFALVNKPIYFYVDTPGSLVHSAMNIADISKSRSILVDYYELVCKSIGLSDPLTAANIAAFAVSPATDGIVTALDEKLTIGLVPPAAAKLDSRFNYLFY